MPKKEKPEKFAEYRDSDGKIYKYPISSPEEEEILCKKWASDENSS